MVPTLNANTLNMRQPDPKQVAQSIVDRLASGHTSIEDVSEYNNPMCKKYPKSEAIPNEDDSCSLCGGDCNR